MKSKTSNDSLLKSYFSSSYTNWWCLLFIRFKVIMFKSKFDNLLSSFVKINSSRDPVPWSKQYQLKSTKDVNIRKMMQNIFVFMNIYQQRYWLSSISLITNEFERTYPWYSWNHVLHKTYLSTKISSITNKYWTKPLNNDLIWGELKGEQTRKWACAWMLEMMVIVCKDFN